MKSGKQDLAVGACCLFVVWLLVLMISLEMSRREQAEQPEQIRMELLEDGRVAIWEKTQ